MKKIIDYGKFAVWSYQRPHLHTRDARRMEGPSVTEWAYCLRSADGTYWNMSTMFSKFGSQDEAIAAAKKVVGED